MVLCMRRGPPSSLCWGGDDRHREGKLGPLKLFPEGQRSGDYCLAEGVLAGRGLMSRAGRKSVASGGLTEEAGGWRNLRSQRPPPGGEGVSVLPTGELAGGPRDLWQEYGKGPSVPEG